MSDYLETIPPAFAENAEKSLLGCLIMDPEQIPIVRAMLPVAAVYCPKNKHIWKAILYLYKRNEPVGFVSVAEALKKHLVYDDAGGVKYLTELQSHVFSTYEAPDHANIVKEKYLFREYRRVNEELTVRITQQHDIQETMSWAEHEFAKIRNGIATNDFIQIGDAAMESVLEMDDESQMLATGFPELDRIVYGAIPGVLRIVAGRPGEGKTAFALSQAANLSGYSQSPDVLKPMGVGIFSFEMKAKELTKRIIGQHAGVNLGRIFGKNMRHDEKQRYHDSAAMLAECPIHISDLAGRTIGEVRAAAQRLKDKHPDVGIIYVDYIQLMRGNNTSGRDNRNYEVGEISTGLKQLGLDLDIQVVGLSQMSRKVEERKGKDRRPRLSDLRDSGQIEQDADQVIFLYAPNLGNEQSNTAFSGTTYCDREAIVAKNRNGALDDVTLIFIKELAQYKALERGNDNAGF